MNIFVLGLGKRAWKISSTHVEFVTEARRWYRKSVDSSAEIIGKYQRAQNGVDIGDTEAECLALFYWSVRSVAEDKRGFRIANFLISWRKHMLWYSSKASHWDASDEQHKNAFHGDIRILEQFFSWKKMF